MEKAEDIFIKHNISVQIPGSGYSTEYKGEMQNRLKFSQKYLKQLLNDQQNIEEVLRKKYIFFEGMNESHINNRKMAFKENDQDDN